MKTKDSFVDALCEEIRLKFENKLLKNHCKTIYWGGGTPSLLTKESFLAIHECLMQRIDRSFVEEVTLEADPRTFDLDLAKTWFDKGVNRISLGAQSFVNEELKAWGRGHREEDIYRAWDILSQAGFKNISMDIMVCCPYQSLEGVKKSLNKMIDLRPPHVSVYAFNLEKNSIWGRKRNHMSKKLMLLEEDSSVEQLELVSSFLEKAKYQRYEISNYALEENFESKHNQGYWSGLSYVGLGPSAHSFDGEKMRSFNEPNLGAYIKSLTQKKLPPCDVEHLTEEQLRLEKLLLGLRTSRGIGKEDLDPKVLSFLNKKKFVNIAFDKVFLTEKGKSVYNTVLEMLI